MTFGLGGTLRMAMESIIVLKEKPEMGQSFLNHVG